MSSEEKAPYFSYRVRIADVKSPKEHVGLKEFTCEVTYGNQDVKYEIKDKSDLGNISEKTVFDQVEELFKQRDQWAEQRGFKFLDKEVKYSG